jgi:hypothetical protein
VIGRLKHCSKTLEVGVKDFQAAGIESLKFRVTLDHVKGSAMLAAGFCERKSSVAEIESSQPNLGRFYRAFVPMKTAGDH